MILFYAVQQSENSFYGHKCETYGSIKLMCRKWACIIEGKDPALLLKIYLLICGNLLESPTTEKSLCVHEGSQVLLKNPVEYPANYQIVSEIRNGDPIGSS